MIPRFVILNLSGPLAGKLTQLGYIVDEGQSPFPDALVIGNRITKNTVDPKIKNPLLKVLDASNLVQIDDIIQLAKLQIQWSPTGDKTELLMGEPARGKVTITRVGVMIDSCVIPIQSFKELRDSLQAVKSPFIASHPAIINPKQPFLTVGCADYSLDDITTIISAHQKLLDPAS